MNNELVEWSLSRNENDMQYYVTSLRFQSETVELFRSTGVDPGFFGGGGPLEKIGKILKKLEKNWTKS